MKQKGYLRFYHILRLRNAQLQTD
uniref:Uncharacterized protein n=1 Tax=Rhizophora mucronata TaxID=61149 RepID=A0A2P2L500_RHIMU